MKIQSDKLEFYRIMYNVGGKTYHTFQIAFILSLRTVETIFYQNFDIN